MHVAVEATRLLTEKRGIGRYVRNVLQAMPEVRPDVRYTLYAKPLDLDGLRKQVAAMPSIAERSTIEPVSKLRSTNADVAWHAWNWILRPSVNVPMVVSIMDLVPMLQFDHRWWKFLKRGKARRRSMLTVERASRILTISEFTAREVTRLLGVPASKMRVTLLAADDFESTAQERSETLDRLGIDGPFFLAVGAQEARKNLIVLFRAMQRLHAEGVHVPLVLCGPGETLAGFARANDAPWLRFAGFVSDRELATLYAKTTALVFPSRYEGFGLPVLEAMSAGAPVICANASSLPEVAGDAALYFEALDDAALAAQMKRIVQDASVRTQLLSRMPLQVSRFSWRQCAVETLLGFDEGIAVGPLRKV
jgi:glycosyltransferase involved in cell wall biosynthesis